MRKKDISERFWNKIEICGDDECWNWKTQKGKQRYGKCKIDGIIFRSHRIAWELVNGKIPDGLCVCHHCDNPSCCNPRHLFLGTHKENMVDMRQKGKGARCPGISNPSAKLTESQVLEIRKLKNEGMNYTKIGSLFGVGRCEVRNICNRNTWKHI